MKKAMRSVVTLLLVAVLLFGISAPTVVYASESADTGNSSTANGSTQTGTGNQTGDGNENEVGGSLDTGWLVLEYDKDSLTVVINPDLDALKDFSKQQIEDVFAELLQAAKTLVIDDVKNGFINDQYGEGVTLDSLTVDQIWEVAFDNYLSTLDPSISQAADPYVAFFEQAVAQDNDTLINGFVEYTCKLIKTAVRMGFVTVEELEDITEDKLKDKVNDLLATEIDSHVKNLVLDYEAKYMAWLTGDSDTLNITDENVVELVNELVSEFVLDMVGGYLNGSLASDASYKVVYSFIDGKVDEAIDRMISSYAGSLPHTTGKPAVDALIASEIAVIKDKAVSDYLAWRFNDGEPGYFVELADSKIKSLIQDELIQNGLTEGSTQYNEAFESAYGNEAEITAKLSDPTNLDSVMESALASYESNKAEYANLITKVKDTVKDNETYADIVAAEVNAVLNANNALLTLRNVIIDAKTNDVEGFDAICALVEDKIESITEISFAEPAVAGDIRDHAFKAILGIGHAEFLTKEEYYISLIYVGFAATLQALKDIDTDLTLAEMMDLVNSITVTGEQTYQIFGNFTGNLVEFSTDAINELLAELPDLSEIRNMADEDMVLNYAVNVDTQFGGCDFTVTIKLGSGYDLVRKVAELITTYIDFRVENGTYVIRANIPAHLAKALRKAAMSANLDPALKLKVFALCDTTVADGMAMYDTDLTFDNLITVLEAIDFREILDSDFVSQFVSLDNLTNEQIIAKVREYENYFNVAKEYGARILKRIPDSLKNKTLMDLYRGNGDFSAAGSATVNIEDVLVKVSEKYGVLIASMLDTEEFTLSVDLKVNLDQINSITYVADGDTVSRGFLPVGADVEFFADTAEYNGKRIVAWVEAERPNVAVELMPDRDLTLVAVFDTDLTLVTTPDINGVYGNEYTLGVTLAGQGNATVQYQWYKEDGTPINATSASFAVSEVAQSGKYYCVVTVTEELIGTKTLTSDLINVTIAPRALVFPQNVQWVVDGAGAYNAAIVYDGNAHTVSLAQGQIPAEAVAVYSETFTATAVGSYTAKVTFTAINGNYYVDPAIEYTLAWEIVSTAIEIDLSTITWNYTTPFVYTGSPFTVTLNLTAEQEAAFTVQYFGNTETAVGDHTATAVATANPGYVLVGAIAPLQWKIEASPVQPTVIDLSTITWNYTTPFVYTGSPFTVTLNLTAEQAAGLNVTYFGNTETNANTYTASAQVAAKQGYDVVGQLSDLTWTIDKQTLTVDGIDWTGNFAFTYDGNDKTVTLGGVDNNLFNVTYEGNVAKNANADGGSYTAKATLTIKDSANYKFADGSATYRLPDKSWTIAKAKIVVSGVNWDYNGGLVYNGQEQSVLLTGVNTDLLNVAYTGNVQTNAGAAYTATATLTPADAANYYIDGVATYELTWSIAKFVIDLSGVTWSYDVSNPFTYDGQTHTVSLVGLPADLPAGLDVVYNGNTAIGAGTYTATATLTGLDDVNYEVSGFVAVSLSWTVNKAVLDMSGVTFENVTVTYDGKAHTITVSGNLPTGVTVTYTPTNSFTAVGVYNVTASFNYDTDNYQTVQPLTATLTIKQAEIIPDKNQFSVGDIIIVESKNPIDGDYNLSAEDKTHIYGEIDLGNGTKAKVHVAYDVTFNKAGAYYPIEDGEFTVQMLVPSVLRDKELSIIYIDSHGEVEVMTATRSDGGEYLVFDTTHFSVYAIAEIVEITPAKEPANLTWLWILLAAILVAAIVVLVILLLKRRKNGGDDDNRRTVVVDDDIDSVDAKPEPKDAKPEPRDDEPAEEPVEEAPAEQKPVETEPKDEAPAEEAPAEEAPAEEAPAEEAPAEEAPAEEAPAEEAPAEEAPAEEAPAEEAPAEEAPAEEAPAEEAPAEEAPAEEAPAEEAPAEEAPAEEAPAEEAPAEEAPAEEAPAEEAPAEEAPVEEAPAEEAPVEEAPAEEAPAEEAPVEEAPAEEAPAEEAPAEEKPEEEAKAEPEIIEAPLVILPAAEGDDANTRRTIIGGREVLVRFRSSFMSRLIQSDETLQNYYSAIKNRILSYKGVKARESWNYEAFNKGRIQCAKLNIKGKALTLYINLDPKAYNVNKYHFTDMSDKPKFDKTPMLLKIRSDRALKYALELIDEMMKTLEIPEGKPQDVDYRMPYESTEELAKRGLVKVILPPGMTLDENSNVVRVDVGALISDAKANAEEAPAEEAPAEEAPAEEAPAEEAPAEEAPVEEAPAEEAPVEEAPAEEAPVEEAPAEEAPVEEAPAEEAPAEEAPVEEAPAEEAPAEEVPAEEEEKESEIIESPLVILPTEGDDNTGRTIIGGREIFFRFRSSFMSRLIQSQTVVQDYYTAIKNRLLSYKGVKARGSWNYEAFNKGRIQCAKLNVKGKTLTLCVNLDPKEYNVNKYHFNDMSDKPKYEKTPMLLKVRSDRALKYALELIDEMMRKLEIPESKPQNVDYHMPYESTDELAKRGLVKVILPVGVTFDEKANIVRVDVNALIDEAKVNAEEAPAEEAPVEEAPAEEAPVEEALAEEAPSEEAPAEEAPVKEAPAEEAPAEEAPVEEAPAEEAPAEEAPAEEAPAEEAPAEEAPAEEAPAEEAPAEEAPVEEEFVHVDAAKADILVSDDEAAASIIVVHSEAKVNNKMALVNLDSICDSFEDGETVDLAALKAKHLVAKNVGKVKILARGTMTKALTIIADKFSLQAVKMITLAGGHAEVIEY